MEINLNDNLYLPQQAIIEDIIQENSLVNTYVLSLCDPLANAGFSFEPGQFMMVSVPHQGEAPISLSSSILNTHTFSLTIRKTGRLTDELHTFAPGDTIGVRGPYGQPFSLDQLKYKKLLFIAGGIGIAPLRPLIEYCYDRAHEFGNIRVIYGCKAVDEFCFKQDIKRWQQAGIDCQLTIDTKVDDWAGHVGLVTQRLDPQVVADHDLFLVCGPGVMIRFVIQRLEQLGVQREYIVTTLERQMKCGVGVCGHCHMGEKLVCVDGPVFNGTELPALDEL
ncbi:MAG: FAD/NAD(P)-binding protein [Thermodesulfobacteriota bacterium]|nr:FAD/NAD(P)-binding protein [Thermodesulfobacteriota bacterium]